MTFINPFDDSDRLPAAQQKFVEPRPQAAQPLGEGSEAKRTQAERVIAKFGGARNLYRALARLDPARHRNPSNIFRWTYPKSKGGTGGLIPTAALADVLDAARLEGIFLTADDLYPGRKP